MKVFRVFGSTFVTWAETPAGKHALIALASALGTAATLAVKALVG